MNRIFYFIIFSILISCGKIEPKGDITEHTMFVEDFMKLNLKGNFRVFYVYSEKNMLLIETYDNLKENLAISVKNNTLNISEKRDVEKADFYNITIYSKYYLKDIQLSNSVDFNLSSKNKTDSFSLFMKDQSSFIGALNIRNGNIEMHQTSRANFSGFSDVLSLKMQDSANIVAPYFELKNVNIEMKNHSYAELFVKDSIKGLVDGTGKFLYYGDAIQDFKIGKNTKVNKGKLN